MGIQVIYCGDETIHQGVLLVVATPRKPYLSDVQWAILEPLLPPWVPAGSPRTTCLCDILNAIFYVLSTGCAWAALPDDFPPEAIAGLRLGKKINEVKRHILVDTLGLLQAVVVHLANILDRDGAKLVFAKAKLLGSWPRMERVWADAGYAGQLIAWVGLFRSVDLGDRQVQRRCEGFQTAADTVGRRANFLLAVELSTYEYWNESGEAMVYLAMNHLMLHRLINPAMNEN